MQKDIIAEIRDAESRADEIVKQANLRAREIAAQAQKDAYNSELNIQAAIQKETAKLVDAAAHEAEGEKKRILLEAQKEAEAMDFLTRPKIAKAADFIIERIVG